MQGELRNKHRIKTEQVGLIAAGPMHSWYAGRLVYIKKKAKSAADISLSAGGRVFGRLSP